MKRILLILAVASTPACILFRGTPIPVEHLRGVTTTGVIWEDTFTGIGKVATANSRVKVDYIGRVYEGTPIDSSYDRGNPVIFFMPSAPVLGWADGIPGMRVGGKRRLVIPPSRAYGDEGIEGLIPPSATLEFQIELLAVE